MRFIMESINQVSAVVAALSAIVAKNISGAHGSYAGRYPYICGDDIKGKLLDVGIACRYDDENTPRFNGAFFVDFLTDTLANCIEYVRTHPDCEIVLSDSVCRVVRYFNNSNVTEATAYVWGSQLGWTDKWRSCPPVSIAQWEAAVVASGVPPFWQA
jgi:hypothetical protein